MIINHNMQAMNTHRQMGVVADYQSKSMEKLSSGYRINRAGDDAAGLAISEKMRGQIRGLDQASRNSQDGISMIQTAEGALNETQSILQRMRELAVQSANDTNVNSDRDALQNEINQLSSEITRIADTTEFNTQNLLNGSLSEVKFQIGANEGQVMELSITDMRAEALDVVSETVDIGTKGAAIKDVEVTDDFAIDGATLTATEGGKVAAKMVGTVANVKTAGYATNISTESTKGITNVSGISLAGDGKITIADTDNTQWDKVFTSGAAADQDNITIGKSGLYLTVDIAYSGASGGSFESYSFDDQVLADEDGNFTYSAHGVSFTMNADEFAKLENDGSNDIKLNIHDAKGSGTTTSAVDSYKVNGATYAETLSGGTDASTFTDNKISLDATNDTWLGGDSIVVSGTGLEASGGSISVLIKSGNVVLSQDTFTADSGSPFGSGSIETFTYNEHGVSFTVDLGSATSVQVSGDFTTYDESADVTAADYAFSIKDDNGDTVSVSGTFANAEELGLEEIAENINNAVELAGGTFAGSVAVVENGSLSLKSAFTGADSNITITTAGGLSNLFTTGVEADGSDVSSVLSLKDGNGDTLTATVAAGDTSVTFTDDDNNKATFGLKGYSDFDNVNISEAFSASEMETVSAGIDISTQDKAGAAVTTINDAIEAVSSERSKLGAIQNRLEHTIANLDTSAENLQSSESRIRDVDMAAEMMEFTKNNILQQAAQSMLSQANQAPQAVLSLLR